MSGQTRGIDINGIKQEFDSNFRYVYFWSHRALRFDRICESVWILFVLEPEISNVSVLEFLKFKAFQTFECICVAGLLNICIFLSFCGHWNV